jgi:hypothetical protein
MIAYRVLEIQDSDVKSDDSTQHRHRRERLRFHLFSKLQTAV